MKSGQRFMAQQRLLVPSIHQKGFTIVELLIVIIVIAILAAITIVAYAGITARSNTSKAQSNAESAQKVAENMNAENGYYPSLAYGTAGSDVSPTPTTTGFFYGSKSTQEPAGMLVVPDTGTSPASTWVGTGASGTSTDGTSRVTYACTAASTSGPCDGKGGRIGYWKFGTGAAVQFVYVGTGSSTSTFFYPAS